MPGRDVDLPGEGVSSEATKDAGGERAGAAMGLRAGDVEGGGETSFPKLNITLNPVAYSALVFNNCLPNGEPDERSLHEGMDVTKGTKYAINGWVRSRSLGGGIPFL